MPAYQVIARKYRPQTFAHVVGQEAVVATLKNALRFGRLAHAYLFCGCRGTGKTTLARLFAKALNCEQRSADCEPCNRCPSCLDIASGRSLDVLEIDGASNRGIDDIRQINETVGYAPSSHQYKIYIIDEVHMLTKEAFNALLKTLEEPPSHVKFFFATTEPHKILPTILSRCQRFDLCRISYEDLTRTLKTIAQDLDVECEEEVFSLIAALAEGSLRDAESLLDQMICYAEPPITLAKVSSSLGILPRSVFFKLDAAFEDQNFSYAFEWASEIFSSGRDLSYFLDSLIEHYRSLLKLKLDSSFTLPTEKLQEGYLQSAARYTQEHCLYILDFLIQSHQQLSKTPFKRVHLEMLLLHLIRSKYRLTLPALVKRLYELEQRASSPDREKIAEKPAMPVASSKKEDSSSHFSELSIGKPEGIAAEKPTTVRQPEPSLDEILIDKIQKKLDSPPSPLLLSKSAWETKAVLAEQSQLLPQEDKKEAPVACPEAPTGEAADKSKAPSIPGCHYDTLLRFAAVELEGVIKNQMKG